MSYFNGFNVEEEAESILIKQSPEKRLIYPLLNNHFISYIGNEFRISEKYKTKPSFIQNVPNMIRIVQSPNHTIWIATVSGLYKIENYNYANYEQELVNGKNVFGRVNDLCIDPYNNRWVATIGNGLIYHTQDTIFTITIKEGLSSNLINHLYVHTDSTVWVATNKGLNVFSYYFENDQLHFSKIKSLTITDGLPANFINDVDYWEDNIWLATNNGVCYFNPDIMNKTYPSIPISIDEFVVNDSVYTISGDLEFNYDQNDVFIEYTGISFRKENEKPFYRYRLLTAEEGQEWFYTNNKNIRFNNLPYGKYIFEVSALNKSNSWSSNPALISFTINPHFSQTIWFKTSTTISVLLVFWFIFNQRLKRIRRREVEKRELQAARLRMREAELAGLRNQMNPHFVFNALNSIQNFIFRKDISKANFYLSKFAQLMRDSLRYTRIDFITLREEIDFLKHYLGLELMRFPEKFDYRFIISKKLDIDYLTIPSLLVQPILENAIKHGFKNISYKGLIEIEISQKGVDKLEVIIKDNGSGLDKKDSTIEKEAKILLEFNHKSLGLAIIKSRIALLNESNNKQKASIQFINLSDTDNPQSGLHVHFTLPITYKL